MEMENTNIVYYKYSESGIKKRNIKLWSDILNYLKDDLEISFKERFYLYESDIVIPKCYCGSILKFIDMKSGYREFCSKTCMYNSSSIKEKRKETCIIKYGVDNPSKLDLFKEKVKITNNINYGVDYPLQSSVIVNKNKKYFMNKYGVDNPSKLKETREKASNTMMDKYGVKHAMLNKDIKEKLSLYFMDKYGVDNPSKLKETREKASNTMFNRYGFKHALQNKDILNKVFLTNISKYGFKSYTSTNKYKESIRDSINYKNTLIVNNDRYELIDSNISEYKILCKSCESEFSIQRQLWRRRDIQKIEICLNCNPIVSGVSVSEKDLLNFITENYKGEIIANHRDKYEIDIYLPELKIGFEYNGLYWHSELNKSKNYQFDKNKYFSDGGINIVNIWEDDWNNKKDIVKSMILNKIGNSNRIFARKCVIKEVDNKFVRYFLVDNHIQGFVGSKIKLGLFHNGELVSLMTFGGLRKSLGQNSKENDYELLRFCNKLNTSVIGGASKLFKHFTRNYNPNNIMTYSLNCHSDGNLYKKLNFDYIKETGVNYFWVKNSIRSHRFNFRKDKLVSQGFDKNKTEVEIMYDRGYYRIFDSGSKKWEINI